MGLLAKIGKILRAFSRKILKTTTRMVLTPVAAMGDVIDWIWTPKSTVDEEIVEDAGRDTVEDAGAQDVVRPAARREMPTESLGRLIKIACQMRENRQDGWEEVFNWSDAAHFRARDWVGSLDEFQVRHVLQMPRSRLEDHILTDCSVGYGLPTYLAFDPDAYAAKIMEQDRQKAIEAKKRMTTNARFGRDFGTYLDDAA